jgi:hypothetical protein
MSPITEETLFSTARVVQDMLLEVQDANAVGMSHDAL